MATINLTDPNDAEEFREINQLVRLRRKRDKALVRSDWTQLPDAPADAAAWATYRQELRDLPASWTPADTVEFPDPPEEAAT